MLFLLDMSTKYKVHSSFHLSHVAFVEEYCHCIPANQSVWRKYIYYFFFCKNGIFFSHVQHNLLWDNCRKSISNWRTFQKTQLDSYKFHQYWLGTFRIGRMQIVRFFCFFFFLPTFFLVILGLEVPWLVNGAIMSQIFSSSLAYSILEPFYWPLPSNNSKCPATSQIL